MSHARSLLSEEGSLITHIFNMPNIAYKKYRGSKTGYVECENVHELDGEGGRQQICRKKYKYVITEMPLTNQQLSDFTAYALDYNDTEKLFQERAVEVPRIVQGTAFDLIQNSYAQGKVIYYFNNNAPFSKYYSEKMAVVLGSYSKVLNNVPTASVPPIAFRFDDDTIAYAVLDFVDSDDKFHFKFIKIEDKYNFIDLREKNPFTGSYTFVNFSQSAWSAFLTALNHSGLMIRGAKESIIPEGTVTIVPLCSSGKVCPQPE
ncbi:hypothetical protein [uncultured Shewanella sp.]|uniref:hypothetical protein n=1 Tax=uncultured Shewanella sp. TaxID=173975 RepID=UPI0026224BD4|nr:hypothetical protein [uncultured Shewanella sp.]